MCLRSTSSSRGLPVSSRATDGVPVGSSRDKMRTGRALTGACLLRRAGAPPRGALAVSPGRSESG
jgi:hypothetical protein